MAKVPTYDAPQVQSSALGTPRTEVAGPRSIANSPDFFGAVQGRQEQELAQVGMRAGAEGTRVIIDMQRRENEDSVFRAEVALKEEYLAAEQEWHEKRRGRFATDLTNDAQKWWDEAGRKHAESLTPLQQREFAKRMTSLRASSLNSVARFQAGELERSHDEAFESNKKISISLAAQDPTRVGPTLEQLRADNVSVAARKGWSAERLAAQNLADSTLLHKNVIQGLVQSDPAGAAEYFEANKAQIDGTQHAEIGKFAKEASATAIGQEIAEAVWMKHGPQKDSDPVSLDKMEEELRKGLKGNPTALEAALKATRERTTAFDKSVKERGAADGSAVAQAILAGKSVKEVMLMPEFLRMPGEQQLKFTDYIENQEYKAEAREAARDQREAAKESREASRETRAWTREQRSRAAAQNKEEDIAKANSAAYWQYRDPTRLNKMSRNEVMQLLPQLGRINTEKLLAEHDRMKGDPNKVYEAKIDQDDFNQAAQSAGMSPFDPKKNEDGKAMLGSLKFHVENVIDREQQAKRRPLTRQEKQQIMTRELDNKVLIDRFMRTDPQVPASVLDAKTAQKAYVMVDGAEIKLSSIPANDRALAIKALQAKNLPVTEQNIATIWARTTKR